MYVGYKQYFYEYDGKVVWSVDLFKQLFFKLIYFKMLCSNH